MSRWFYYIVKQLWSNGDIAVRYALHPSYPRNVIFALIGVISLRR